MTTLRSGVSWWTAPGKIVAVAAMTTAIGLAAVSGAVAQTTSGEAAKARKGELDRSLQRTDASGTPVSESTVTFQDVLQNPSDPAINLAYARRLIAESRLELASATLERILLQYPNLNDVRLLYAVVLYRLDSLDEARSELELLLSRDTTASIRTEAERYAGLIRTAQQRFQKSASLSLGVHLDTNRNAYPGGGDFIVLNAPVQGTGKRERDVGWMALGTAEIRYDTGDQQTQELNARMTAIVDNQVKIDPLDLRGAIFEFGAVHKEMIADFKPRVRYGYIELSQRKYIADTAVGMAVEKKVPLPGVTAIVDAELGYEDYSNTDDVPLATEQEGRYWDVKVGGTYVLDPSARFTGFLHHKDKNADKQYESYRSTGIELSLLKILPYSSYVTVDGFFDFQTYRQPDPFITTSKRRSERDWSLSLTYGLPMMELIHMFDETVTLPDGWNDFDLSFTGTYTRQDSNIPNYDYGNWRAQALISKRWTF